MTKPQHSPRQSAVVRRLIFALIAALLVIVVLLIPVPYVVYSPGPTFNVLGSQGDQQILEIREPDQGGQSGAEITADTTGQLRMVTVSELGGPGSRVTLGQALAGWLRPSDDVAALRDVYPPGVTAEELNQFTDLQMASSHSTASVAALGYLGYDMPTVFTISGAVPGSSAEGKVREGDILRSIRTADGVVHPMGQPAAPFALVATLPVGSEVELAVVRDGKDLTIPLVTTADQTDAESEQSGGSSQSDDPAPAEPKPAEPDEPAEKGSKMGIFLDLDIDMPLTVDIHLEQIGGPSAGTIFALSVIDVLEGGGLVGDQIVAGTGAISYDGQVQPIGGIVQKLYGAEHDGAGWFLAPAANCAEAAGHEPKGMPVVAVATLDEAVDAARAIGEGRGDTLPTCRDWVADADAAVQGEPKE